MEESFAREGSETQQEHGLAAGLRFLDRLERWLAHIVEYAQLTKDEQTSAGIHVGSLSEEERLDAGFYPGE